MFSQANKRFAARRFFGKRWQRDWQPQKGGCRGSV